MNDNKVFNIVARIEKEAPKTIFEATRKKYLRVVRSNIPVVTGKTLRSLKTIKNPSTGDMGSVIIARSANSSLAFLNPLPDRRTLGQMKLMVGLDHKGEFFYWRQSDAKSTKAKRQSYMAYLSKWGLMTTPVLNTPDSRGIWIGGKNTHWGKGDNLWFDKSNKELKQTLYKPLRRSLFKMLKNIKQTTR